MRGSLGQAVAAALLLGGLLAPAAGAVPLEDLPWDGPDTSGVPAGDARHFRLALKVTPPALPDVTGLPVGATLDLAAELAAGGYPHDPDTLDLKGFRLNLDSFVLHAVDDAGRITARNVAVDVRPAAGADNSAFDAAQNPVVAVRWALPPGPAGVRHFHLYFDSQAHGTLPRVTPADVDLERLATSVGPGRGTRLYAALPSLPGALQGDEPRSLRIAAPDGARVVVHEYDQFDVPQPMATLDVPSMQARTYRLGNNGALPSRGLVMVTSDKPVLVEALYRGPSAHFLPSLQGGAVGSRFFHVPAGAEDWSVVCPSTPEMAASGAPSCRATVSQGGAVQSIEVGLNAERRVSVAAGQAVQVEASRGQVAVERLGSGVALWPPLDGPRRARLFIGEAGAGDRLHVAARQAGASALVQSLEGARPILDPNLRLDNPLDAPWGRNWASGKDHAGGTALVRANLPGSLVVVSGTRDPHDPARYGAMVAMPTPDGGYTYTVPVPKDAAGVAVGGVVLFAPSAGTSVQARLVDGAASTLTTVRTQAADEPILLDGAGVWQVTADRPVVAQWLAPGLDAFGGFASGFTDAAAVEVADAQYAARAFDLEALEPILLAPADAEEVTFSIQVRNAGRKVDGSPFADVVRLELPVPAGWPEALVAPSVVNLAANGAETVEATVRIPDGVAAASSGVTLSLVGTLRDVPGLPPSGLMVTEQLRISFTTHRAVQVTADGFDDLSESGLQDGKATFGLHVINTGSVADTYDLEMSAVPTGWVLTLDCEACEGTLGEDLASPVLGSGETLQLEVTLELQGAAAGRASVSVEATSQEDRSVGDSVRLVAATDVHRSVTARVAQPVIVTPPGTVATFTVTLTNTADVPEELNVSLQSFRPPGWEAPAILVGDQPLGTDPRIGIEADSDRTLTVRQPIPKEARSGQVALDRLQFASTLSSKLAFDVELRAVAGRVDGLTLEGPSSLALLPGQAFELELAVASASNHNVSARIEPRATYPGDWSFQDSQGAAPPWNVTLAQGDRKVLVVQGRAPPGLPPTQATLHRLEFRVLASGTTGLAAVVPLSVPAVVAVRAEVAQDRLVRGVENLVALRVANDGNLPVEYTSSWVGLPEGWTGAGPRGQLAAGSAANATAVLDVPATEDAHARDLVLRILSADGETLADVPVRVGLGTPVLAAELGARLPLADGRSTYRIHVSNLGNASAYDVRIRLERDGEVLDQALLHQVRPGAVQQANLLGPADAAGLRVVVESPQGQAQVDVAAGAAGKDAPVPAAAALAALAAALAARRGRRPA